MNDSADRLAQSRLAIIEHLHRNEHEHDKPKPVRLAGQRPSMVLVDKIQQRLNTGWLGGVRQALSVWWRGHPGRTAVELATPYLSSFGRQSPVKFLGIASAAGVLLYLVKPWKLLSVTGLLAALFKSTKLSTLLMSGLSAVSFQKVHRTGVSKIIRR